MAKKRPKTSHPKPAPQPKSRASLIALICALLIAVTIAAYWQAPKCGFIDSFDDAIYVHENHDITHGISLDSIKWAFTTYRTGNWHPLTWLSLMADYQAHGLDPAGYHLTNVAFHIASTLLLFLVLSRMTGAVWRSAFVAALFAIHPIHVESVAWIAERKDVLSTFLWLVTLYLYVLYVKRPRALTYIAMLLAYGLGLLAKPMLVSLPIVLLLLDYWPLGRVVESSKSEVERRDPPFPALHSPLSTLHLFLEKLPLFAMAVASSVITVIAQRSSDAVAELTRLPVGVRLANVVVSYVAYIWKSIWPSGLAIFYPHPGRHLPVWQTTGAVLILAIATIIALKSARRRPYITMGWLWYVITLVPVIGIVQVGMQGMADRYTYMPLTGLFIILAWTIPDLLSQRSGRASKPSALSRPQAVSKGSQTPSALSRPGLDAVSKGGLGVVAIALIAALAVATYFQVGYWRTPYALFSHAMNVTEGNSVACVRVARAIEEDDPARALSLCEKAVEMHPGSGDAQLEYGRMLTDHDRPGEAMPHLLAAERAWPRRVEVHYDLARAYYQLFLPPYNQNTLDQAEQECRTALEIDPTHAATENQLGLVYLRQGHMDEAIPLWESSARHDPTYAEPHGNLAVAYYMKQDYAAAWREIHARY